MANMLFVVLAAIIMVMNGVSAETHVVGDDNGWTVQPDYKAWAAKNSFAVGDVLEFNFSPPHTLAEVSKEGFDACDAGDAEIISVGPKQITLTEDKTYYFICTFASHCTGGQKLEVKIGDAAAAADAPSPAPTTPVQTPAAPSDTGSSPPSQITSIFSVSFIATFVMAYLF